MASVLDPPGGENRRGEPVRETDETESVSTDELADLLGDESTRRILEAISDEAKAGREIAESCSLSRPTVYRRLNRLEEAELVDVTMAISTDGHHHKQYRAEFETVSVQLDGDGLTVSVRTERTDADAGFGA